MTDAVLCHVDDIPAGRAIGRDLAVAGQSVPVVVLWHDGAIRAFLNSCPHVGVRLDWRPDDFLDVSESFLQCSTHGAIFEKARGLCLEGPCRGAALVPVPTRLDRDGRIWALDTETLPTNARLASRR